MQRLGNWTASAFKALMSSSQSGAKISWSENHRIFLFGKTALKYIYSNGKERQTGRYIDKGDGTLKMKYGTAVEPLISKLTKQQLKKEGVEMRKSNLTNYAGVVLKRIPKYWLSSHSSVFGVDKSFGEYLKEKSYFPVFFRAGLLLFHGVLMLMAFMGMIYSLKSFRNWSILLLVFLYFNMHILFDMCPRYFIPIFPYIFVFCSVFIIRAREKLNLVRGIEKSRDVKSGFSL